MNSSSNEDHELKGFALALSRALESISLIESLPGDRLRVTLSQGDCVCLGAEESYSFGAYLRDLQRNERKAA